MVSVGYTLSLTASGTHPGAFLVRYCSLLIDTPMNNLSGRGFTVGTFSYDGDTNEEISGLFVADVRNHTQFQGWLVGDPDWATGALTSQTLVASLDGEYPSLGSTDFSGVLNGSFYDDIVTSAEYAVQTDQVTAPRSSDFEITSGTHMVQFVPPDGSADFPLTPTELPNVTLEVNMSHSGAITGGGLGVMPGRFEIELCSFVVIDPTSSQKDRGFTAGKFFMSDYAEQGTMRGVVLGNVGPGTSSSTRQMDALLFSTEATGTFKGLFLYGSLKGEFSETTPGGEFGAFSGSLKALYYNESRVYGAGFDAGREGWSFATAEPTFSAPEGRFTTGTLEIAITSNENNFGFWISPLILVEAGKIYRVDFTVWTDITLQALVPVIRLRMNTNNLQQSCGLVINSADNAESSPTPAGMTYSLYFVPPESAISGPSPGMKLSFDLLNFGAVDSETGSLFLDTVTIKSSNLPIM